MTPTKKLKSIQTKRIYDARADDDGLRILVDRIWPRGISKEKAQLDLWLKEIAPTTEMRKRFHGHPEQWDEFKKAYFDHLDNSNEATDALEQLREAAAGNHITLLYAARGTEQNNAVALKEYLEAAQ